MILTIYTATDAEKLPGDYDEEGTVSLPWGDSSNYPYWVIKRDPIGIKWTSQVGGFACLHPVFQGVLLAPDGEMAKVLEEIERHTYEKYGGYCVPEKHFFHEEGPGKNFTEEDARHFDDLLKQCTSHKIIIDRARLKESCEAWIYALIDGIPCVLTGLNSD